MDMEDCVKQFVDTSYKMLRGFFGKETENYTR